MAPDRTEHDVRHHVEEARVVVDGVGAHHRQADLPADRRRFLIEVVQHLDVIADEADRAEHGRTQPAGARATEIVADVRTQPGILGPPAAALVDELPLTHVRQLRESARLVAEASDIRDWELVYQSRSGRPEDPWLGPDVGEYLRRARAEGLQAAILCPIGFVCDHVEVLYDLDQEAATICREIGLPMVRAAAVNDDPRFLDMMADVVLRTIRRHETGRPLALAAAGGPEGPPLRPGTARS